MSKKKIEFEVDEDILDTFINNCEANDLDTSRLVERMIEDFNNKFLKQLNKYLGGCVR